MTNHFALGMTKATELTKAGKLAEATALIQSLMTDKTLDTAVLPEPTVIEGAFTRLDDAGPANATKPQPAQHSSNLPRSALRETLRKIAAGGMPAPARFANARAPLPDGA